MTFYLVISYTAIQVRAPFIENTSIQVSPLPFL
jgi:hypothetical protein